MNMFSRLNYSNLFFKFYRRMAAVFKLYSTFILLVILIWPEMLLANNLNKIMAQIGTLMSEIQLIALSDKRFAEKNNQNTVRSNLKQLHGLFQQAKPFIKEKSETYQVSYDLIVNSLEEISNALDGGYSYYTQNRIKALGAICVSCHTQDHMNRKLFPGVDRKKFDSDLEYAQFNFMTRNYELAKKYYLKSVKKPNVNEQVVLYVMQRLLGIALQVQNDIPGATKTMRDLTSLKGHTAYSRNKLSAWITGLETLSKLAKDIDRTKVGFPQLQQQVDKLLGPSVEGYAALLSSGEELPLRIWLRGALYDFLNRSSEPNHVAFALYWLAICDRSLNYDFFYSLADLYLKDCISKYPKTEFAPKCFDEYQDYTIFSYSGSSGTHLPPDVLNELKLLRKKLQP